MIHGLRAPRWCFLSLVCIVPLKAAQTPMESLKMKVMGRHCEKPATDIWGLPDESLKMLEDRGDTLLF